MNHYDAFRLDQESHQAVKKKFCIREDKSNRTERETSLSLEVQSNLNSQKKQIVIQYRVSIQMNHYDAFRLDQESHQAVKKKFCIREDKSNRTERETSLSLEVQSNLNSQKKQIVIQYRVSIQMNHYDAFRLDQESHQAVKKKFCIREDKSNRTERETSLSLEVQSNLNSQKKQIVIQYRVSIQMNHYDAFRLDQESHQAVKKKFCIREDKSNRTERETSLSLEVQSNLNSQRKQIVIQYRVSIQMNHYDAFRLDQESHQAVKKKFCIREDKSNRTERETSLSLEVQSNLNSQRKQIVIQYRVSIQMNHYDAFRLDQESHQAVKKKFCIREDKSNRTERETSLSLEVQSNLNSQKKQIVIQYRVSIQMNHYDAFRLDQESHQAVKKKFCIREDKSNRTERETSLSLEVQSNLNSQKKQIVIQYRVSIQMNHYDAFRLDQESHQAVKKKFCIREDKSNRTERETSLSLEVQSNLNSQKKQIVIQYRVSIQMNHYDAFRLDQESHQAVKKKFCIREDKSNRTERETSLSLEVQSNLNSQKKQIVIQYRVSIQMNHYDAFRLDQESHQRG